MGRETKPFEDARAVTLSDTATFAATTAIYIGTAGATGTLVVTLKDGRSATFVGLQAGRIYPISITQAKTTGSDVSNVMVFY